VNDDGMRTITFGYAVATVDGKLLENEVFVNQLNLASDAVVIVNQSDSFPIDSSLFSDHVKVINSPTKGLSISRNIALKSLQNDFVILCDDDIELNAANIERVKKVISEKPQVALYFTQLEKSDGDPWRMEYKSRPYSIKGLSFQSKRKIQKINSMEQILSLSYLKENNLWFNETFGAGSGVYPLGEETLMSYEILRSGGELQYIPLVTRIHPPFSSGMNTDWKSRRSVWAIYRKIFWPWGTLMFLSVLFKRLLLSNYTNHNRVL